MIGQHTEFPYCVIDPVDGGVVERFETEEEAQEYLLTPLHEIGFTVEFIDEQEREAAFRD